MLHLLLSSILQLLLLHSIVQITLGFSPHLHLNSRIPSPSNKLDTKLYGGKGRTEKFSWTESQFEIEIKIPVPSAVTTKNISYKAKSKSIGLDLVMNGDTTPILDIKREFRGLIDLDGTFWTLVDAEDHDGKDIVISIEKFIMPPSDPFAIVDYDWNGIYPNDDKEVIEKVYAEPEELNIREYAKSLGVDIDNINMTMVDKNMFSSGLNMTRSTLDELTKAGYAKEVTRQGDGTEYIERGTQGSIPFDPLGKNIGRDEMKDAGVDMNSGPKENINPFMSRDSPWLDSIPAEESVPVENEAEKFREKVSVDNKASQSKMTDPIEKLTVTKLKEILKKEGLKVSGTKEELTKRLKSYIQDKMEKKKEQDWQ